MINSQLLFDKSPSLAH